MITNLINQIKMNESIIKDTDINEKSNWKRLIKENQMLEFNKEFEWEKL